MAVIKEDTWKKNLLSMKFLPWILGKFKVVLGLICLPLLPGSAYRVLLAQRNHTSEAFDNNSCQGYIVTFLETISEIASAGSWQSESKTTFLE
jgi:hypothetical protein